RAVNIPYLEEMKQEILGVIKKYINAHKIDIRTDSNQNFKTLEVEIFFDK
ncbi:MAG: cell division topological specificity factor MinE, partial [Helicobacter sp.]|nr:cell division topological specificity factor MinE [Helicobacter sp.]